MIKNSKGGKQSECENCFKWGAKGCVMMRGFQTWPQSSNRITFDPFLAKKLSKTGNIPDLANFQQFFGGQKGSYVIRFEF